MISYLVNIYFLGFHEFEMLLARVAVEFGMKEDGGG